LWGIGKIIEDKKVYTLILFIPVINIKCYNALFFRSSHRGGQIKLRAAEEFRETSKKAEKRIFELVNSKIDDFLELADYDW